MGYVIAQSSRWIPQAPTPYEPPASTIVTPTAQVVEPREMHSLIKRVFMRTTKER